MKIVMNSISYLPENVSQSYKYIAKHHFLEGFFILFSGKMFDLVCHHKAAKL